MRYGGSAQAINAGLLKVMAKMGISTLQSYKGAQIFEALGLHPDVVAAAFVGTPSRVAGVSFETLASDTLALHAAAYRDVPLPEDSADARRAAQPGRLHVPQPHRGRRNRGAPERPHRHLQAAGGRVHQQVRGARQ